MKSQPTYTIEDLVRWLDLGSADAAFLFESEGQALENRILLSSIIFDLSTILGLGEALRWLLAPNEIFEERAAIELILNDLDGLKRVQRYVKAVAANTW